MTATKRKPSAATVRKQAAVEAYKAKFGHAPPPRMSADAMQRWTEGPMKAAPGRTGDPAYERTVNTAKSKAQRAQAGVAPAATAAKPAPAAPAASGGWRLQPGREPSAEARRNQRLWRGYNSQQVVKAISKAPYDTAFKAWLDNRYNNRPVAAQALRDYRASLGRNAPSTLSSAVSKGRTAEFVASRTGKAMQTFNPYRDNAGLHGVAKVLGTMAFSGYVGYRATEGFLFGGYKGAAREGFDAVTFGFGGKAFDKVFGDAPDWNRVAKTFEMETPGQTGARKRAEMINARPTKAARVALDKAQGRVPQKDVPVPGKERFDGHGLGAAGVGFLAANTTFIATAALGKGIDAAGRALVKAAPTLSGAGKIASRAVPALALAAGAYTVGSRAVEGYRQGGVAGAVKGAGAGALSFATFGASDALMSRFQSANAGYQVRQAAASASPGPSGVVDGGRGWANPKVQKAAQEARGRTYTGPGA